MYYYNPEHEAYQDAVIGKDGILRETTDLEKLIVKWCFNHPTAGKCAAEIGCAEFEYEPYHEEWFDGAIKEFSARIKEKRYRYTRLEREIATRTGIRRGSLKKKVRNTDTGEVFESMTDACRAYRMDKKNLGKAIKKHWRAGGHYWEFVEEARTEESRKA